MIDLSTPCVFLTIIFNVSVERIGYKKCLRYGNRVLTINFIKKTATYHLQMVLEHWMYNGAIQLGSLIKKLNNCAENKISNNVEQHVWEVWNQTINQVQGKKAKKNISLM